MTNSKKEKKKKKERPEITPENFTAETAAIFRNNPFKSYGIKSLCGLLNCSTKQQRAEVREIVSQLHADGTIDLLSNRRYKLSTAKEEPLEGIADMTSSGIVYVIIEGQEKDIVVEPQNTAHALHGDTVKVVPIRRRRNGAVEGEIVEIVKRSEKKYVGKVELTGNFAFVVADSKKMPNDIFVPLRDLHDAKDGSKVLVRIIDWPMTMKNPMGEIIDVFGMAGDNDTEMHAILAEYDLPYRFPEEVSEAANRIPSEITSEDLRVRRDMRDIPTFTIDPADAKDFDDALSIRKLPDGNLEIGVHIADVTHYVLPGSIVDTEAEERATSVYLVDRTIPMLPEKLSNDLCSLRPNEDKLCFSAVFEMSEDSTIVKEWFGRTIIHSNKRFSYEDAQKIIEGAEGELKDEILTLNALARLLRAERFRNGSIAFERDEAKFEIDETGKPLRVYFKVMKESNQLIEEFMLLANRKVAEFIGRKRKGQTAERTFVYRIHDTPSIEKLTEFKSFILKFGYIMHADKGRAVAREMNELLGQISGTPEENILSILAIRTMAKATYSTNNIGHYGLAFDFYTHFTSPIRRYPDMMVHRLLAHYLAGGASENKELYEAQCEHSSEMEIRAAEAERASIKYKMVEFMADKIGEEFAGTISGVTEWGIYVELIETKIEGMVSLRDMGDDYYVFDEKTYSVTGRVNEKRYILGDIVTVRVKRADLQRKQLDFEMVV